VEHEYSSAYRGRVQNRKVGDEFMPMYVLSYRKNDADVSSYTAFDSEVEHFNQTAAPRHRINITCNPKTLSEGETKAYFSLIDTLSVAIDAIKNLNREKGLLVQRAIAYAVTQNFDAAINDLTAYVQQDSTLAMAYWQRAVCQSLINEFAQSQGIESKLKSLGTLDDFAKAAQLNPHNPYILYDRANVYAARKEYKKAIDDYTRALDMEPRLAEAYYNRGLAFINSGQLEKGIEDLSKAGELGLYDAYGVIKKYRTK
jgi:tetratricopeptide (TPR) repeat protein